MAATSVGVTAEPELKCFQPLTPANKFIVIASDGIWDRLSNHEVMSIIAQQFYPSRDADGACNYLVKEAADRWQIEQGMVDDITIIVAFLNVGGMTKLNTAESNERPAGAVPAAI
jgi:serine/threonine protein phosphatase PrpC